MNRSAVLGLANVPPCVSASSRRRWSLPWPQTSNAYHHTIQHENNWRPKVMVIKKEKKNTEIRGMRRTLFYLTILSRWWRFNAGQHHINLHVFFCLGWHRVWYSRHGRVYTNCVEKKKKTLLLCVCVCRHHNDNLDDDDGNIRLPGPKLKALKIKLIGKKSWNSAHLPSFPTTRGTTATGSIIHTHTHCVCTRTDKNSLSLLLTSIHKRGW